MIKRTLMAVAISGLFRPLVQARYIEPQPRRVALMTGRSVGKTEAMQHQAHTYLSRVK